MMKRLIFRSKPKLDTIYYLPSSQSLSNYMVSLISAEYLQKPNFKPFNKQFGYLIQEKQILTIKQLPKLLCFKQNIFRNPSLNLLTSTSAISSRKKAKVSLKNNGQIPFYTHSALTISLNSTSKTTFLNFTSKTEFHFENYISEFHFENTTCHKIRTQYAVIRNLRLQTL